MPRALRRLRIALLPCVALCLGAGGPRVEDALPWHRGGVWLAGDLHTHYITERDRQGASIVAAARHEGLDFLVSTDHAQRALGKEAEERLARRRAGAPGLLLLAGIEWNMPGGDHAAVVVEQSPREYELLREFAARFDREVSPALREPEAAALPEDEDDEDAAAEVWGDLGVAVAGLNWLARQVDEGRPRTAVYLNHPGKHGWLSLDDVARLLDAGLDGIEAAPGHQNHDPLVPAYAIDRHEPMVAEVGGDYDRLAHRGYRPGISASSDFHVKRTSYLPGVFSRTWVLAPARSAAGVVAGLAAGATVTALGGLVTMAATRTTAAGYDDAALPAETLLVPAGTRVTYRILADIPDSDFEDIPNRIDRVEIISDCAGPPRVVAVLDGQGPGSMGLDWVLPAAWTESPTVCFLRVRGRRFVGGPGNGARDADHLFHVAPTRLRVTE